MPTPGAQHREQIEATVLEAVRSLLRELGSAETAERASLRSALDKDLGLGSLERVELLVRLERALAARLPETGVQAAETPGDWVRIALEAAGGLQPATRWPITQPPSEACEAPGNATTFSEVLHRQVERDPARTHVHLLDQDSGQDISVGQLFESASRMAAGLVASGLRPGETVAIMLPTCADFFSSFLGVMLAGGVAVPVYPPARANQIEAYIQRQSRILQNAGVRFLITFDRVRTVANVLGGQLQSLQEFLSAEQLASRGQNLPTPEVGPAEICFIQYTSGSTGDPKGVTLTHSNVLANIRGIGFAVEVKPSDAVVTWLPLYHDMGLIGSWLFSLYHGLPITVLSPLDFLVRPERWLWALSDSGGTLCPAPNFAFELCVRKITDAAMDGVDLSPWRVAINAGESVLPATLKRFTGRFRPWGFDPRSFMPFYGLAESSVALTYPPYWRGPVVDIIDRTRYEVEGRAVPATAGASSTPLEFVGNGKPLPEHEVKIVGAEGATLPDRMRGRILFRGPSRTDGYFRNEQATTEALDADGWMDSGDLGYLAAGELYVTGRLKDCIIIGGRNIIPQDVEMASWDVDGVRKGCVAAFGSVDPETGTEKLVVVAETRVADSAQRQHLRAAVTEIVASRVGVPPGDVALVQPGVVPKTSSGKIQRSAIRHSYEAGKLAGRASAPTWLQLSRIWMRGTLRSSAGMATDAGRLSLRVGQQLLGGLAGAVFGLAARLAPTPAAARYAVAPGARILAALSGARLRGRLKADSASVLLVARNERVDPLMVAALYRRPFVFADRTGFGELNPSEAFLLEPLVAEPVAELSAPPGGDLRARMESALAHGRSVASLADSPIGAPPDRSRFRAEGFAAANDCGVPLIPVHLERLADGSIRASQGGPMAIAASNGKLAGARAMVRSCLRAAASQSGE